jgi:hypothetical protein
VRVTVTVDVAAVPPAKVVPLKVSAVPFVTAPRDASIEYCRPATTPWPVEVAPAAAPSQATVGAVAPRVQLIVAVLTEVTAVVVNALYATPVKSSAVEVSK